MQLQSGQIDVMGDIPASLMDVVRTTEGLTLETFESTRTPSITTMRWK